MRVIEESRDSRRILATFNTTFIALIHKLNNPFTYEEYKPISLYNCVYIIISKIIVMMVKVLLFKNLSHEQVVFVASTQIHEVVGATREVFDSIKTKRMPTIILKIDLSKAYDIIS